MRGGRAVGTERNQLGRLGRRPWRLVGTASWAPASQPALVPANPPPTCKTCSGGLLHLTVLHAPSGCVCTLCFIEIRSLPRSFSSRLAKTRNQGKSDGNKTLELHNFQTSFDLLLFLIDDQQSLLENFILFIYLFTTRYCISVGCSRRAFSLLPNYSDDLGLGDSIMSCVLIRLEIKLCTLSRHATLICMGTRGLKILLLIVSCVPVYFGIKIRINT
jgi:hypothetical protein